MMERIKAWIRLAATKELGFPRSIHIVETFGEPENYIGREHAELQQSSLLSAKSKEDILRPDDPPEWPRICKLIEHYHLSFITYLDDEYPAILKTIFSPPLYFYVRGKWNKADVHRALGIVGTRKATAYGRSVTTDFAGTLAKSGFTIVSGLAHGIDTAAHRAALDAGGRTIAVMGTGCDQIYPPENRELAEDICAQGCLISEYDPGVKPERWNFPARNRIISGLSLGCLVVEGSEKSGALLTAKFALDQNRELFAIPGDINREGSQGPNYLLKMGAKPALKPQDILDEYQIAYQETEQQYIFPELNAKEDRIYQFMLQNRPEVYFDQLIVNTGYSVGELSTLLLSLELKKVIQRLPGSKFSLGY